MTRASCLSSSFSLFLAVFRLGFLRGLCWVICVALDRRRRRRSQGGTPRRAASLLCGGAVWWWFEGLRCSPFPGVAVSCAWCYALPPAHALGCSGRAEARQKRRVRPVPGWSCLCLYRSQRRLDWLASFAKPALTPALDTPKVAPRIRSWVSTQRCLPVQLYVHVPEPASRAHFFDPHYGPAAGAPWGGGIAVNSDIHDFRAGDGILYGLR